MHIKLQIIQLTSDVCLL